MTNSPERDQARQGWIQTLLICAVTLVSVAAAFFKLDARADTALTTAGRAEIHAADVEKHASSLDQIVAEQKTELVRIRTILDERLPKRAPEKKDE